jgi:hypothetical protein
MLVPLCALIIALGVFPSPIMRRMEPTLTRLVSQVQTRAAQQNGQTRAAALGLAEPAAVRAPVLPTSGEGR